MLDTNTLDNLVRAADPATSDADLAAQTGWGTPLSQVRPYYVNHRTMLDVCCSVDPTNGTGAAEWVAAAIKAKLPATYSIYVAPGTSTGDGGGLDASNPATVAFVNQLVAASGTDPTFPGLFARAMGDAVIALGHSQTYLAGDAVTAADVTASRARINRPALSAALAQRIQATATLFINGRLNPAVSGSAPLPTWADYVASLPQS